MRDVSLALDIVLSLLVVFGAAFALIGAWGRVKPSGFLKRLHGPTRASTVGVGAVLLASIGYFAAADMASLHELLIALFVFMTAPVAAHRLVKAAAHVDPRLRPPGVPPQRDSTTADR